MNSTNDPQKVLLQGGKKTRPKEEVTSVPRNSAKNRTTGVIRERTQPIKGRRLQQRRGTKREKGRRI